MKTGGVKIAKDQLKELFYPENFKGISNYKTRVLIRFACRFFSENFFFLSGHISMLMPAGMWQTAKTS